MNQTVLDSKQTSARTILVAKNSGLRAPALEALAAHGVGIGETVSFVRGEDVPMIANSLAQGGRRLFAVTGEDLLDEWIARGNLLSSRIRRTRVEWNDRNAVYGKPALCFLGKERPAATGSFRVAVSSRYRELTQRYLRVLIDRGAAITCIEVSGALEAVYAQGIADYIVDIVVTGATMSSYGLSVLDVLLKSDLAVLEA